MLRKFFSELAQPGCFIQLGTENIVLKSLENPYDGEIEQFVNSYRMKNLYFLGGVRKDEKLKFYRAKDSDVISKNYFYLDLDIRKSKPDISDEEIKTTVKDWAVGILNETGSPYSDWRYIAFTGNGLHFYYFGEPIQIPEKEIWRYGINDFIDVIEKSFNEKFDRACSNPARIARIPGSINHKPHGNKQSEILLFQDKKINLLNILERGKKCSLESIEAARKKRDVIKSLFPDSDDAYKAIDSIPVGKLMCMLTGWEISPDGKNFYSPGQRERKGCFVSSDKNAIMTGGTSHLPHDKDGYRPFELVKAYKKLDNRGTFEWFKSAFPEIRRISENKKMGVTVDVTQGYSIKNAFEELKHMEVRQLGLGGHWDDWRLLLRGKVTRIGAMPGTGKSKLGYYLTHLLLKKEYRGLFFSTEVQAPEVIAHLLQVHMKRPYLDILEGRVEVAPELEDNYRNLKVYDVRHTGNSLTKIEQIIKREADMSEAKNGRGLDFIVIDFSQQVTPKSNRYSDIYTWATEWGNQCQEISQKYGVCFIDVCQLSVKGNKDEDEKYGHVPYEGGNKLVQTADIASMIWRDKGATTQTDQIFWDIRKSKSMGRRFRLDMRYSYPTGEFTLASAQDSRTDDTLGGLHNYLS
mgnify:CR=1 FL=1